VFAFGEGGEERVEGVVAHFDCFSSGFESVTWCRIREYLNFIAIWKFGGGAREI
jgi:hypothetical protein